MVWWNFFFVITMSLLSGVAANIGIYTNARAHTDNLEKLNYSLETNLPPISGNILVSTGESLIFNARISRILTTDPQPCSEDEGKIEHGSLKSRSSSTPLEYRIYLPPCYEKELQNRYPVLYLLHGKGFKDDQWDRIGADETADALIQSRVAPPFIIVMPLEPNNDKNSQHNFGQILVEELLPHVDKQYRTIPERKHRAIGGLSRGAGWAVNTGIRKWNLFGAIGAHSMAVLNDDWNKMSALLDTIPLESFPAIYIDTGNKDLPSILDSSRWFGDMLNQKGLPHEWYLFTGIHDEAYWSRHVEGYLRWYSSNW